MALSDWEDIDTDDELAEEFEKQDLTHNKPIVPTCTSCKKAQDDLPLPLKCCAKCKQDLYCSRECQKADWKRHKKTCGTATAGTAQSKIGRASNCTSTSSKPCSINKPFTALKNGAWLKNRPQKDVYQLLIDVYRLRLDDDYTFNGDVDIGSLYDGSSVSSALRHFKKFLQNATKLDSKRSGVKKVLPDWWTTADIQACIEVGKKSKGWAYIGAAVEKSDITEHYDDARMPMQLRMFNEILDGTLTAGQPCKMMLESLAMTEQGNVHSVTLDELRRRM